MAEIQEMRAESRTGTGKGPAYRARQKGLIPAVVYGGDVDPENVAIDAHSVTLKVDAGHFTTTLLMLDVEGKKTRVLPRAVQLDPVTDRPVHVDFMRLGEGAKVRLAIPVHFKNQGESPGLKKGGVLNIVRHDIELLCPAESIPNTIEIDLAGLDIHDSVHISSVALPEGVRPIVRERDFTICSIVAPTSVIDEQRAAAAAAASAAAAPAAEEAAAPAADAAKAAEKK
ncbi:MAG: 50S ribosomal protein L25/general stress protein Ctc [Proteobacteria bacterium]|nr:50S ribosomal protein L25/general stress protein Ctc [Pseudomonadota bacterium]